MPLIGIVARKKDIKDIKRKLGENYELIELNNESIKNLKNIKFDEIIYNKDINLTEEEYKFMREIINKTKYILINSDEKANGVKPEFVEKNYTCTIVNQLGIWHIWL